MPNDPIRTKTEVNSLGTMLTTVPYRVVTTFFRFSENPRRRSQLAQNSAKNGAREAKCLPTTRPWLPSPRLLLTRSLDRRSISRTVGPVGRSSASRSATFAATSGSCRRATRTIRYPSSGCSSGFCEIRGVPVKSLFAALLLRSNFNSLVGVYLGPGRAILVFFFIPYATY